MKRNLTRCIYSSSYDRGLEHLLKMWPDIKKEVPSATLDVYYGWKLFAQFYKDNPASMLWKENMDKMMTQDGVKDHDRISQDQLKKEYETSAVLAYPTHFGEINCISALKAQAYGAIPVVINYAALKETVQFGIKINGDVYDKETRDVYKKWLIWVLKNPDWQREVRPPMMEWGKLITWRAVAKQWDSVFKGKDASTPITEAKSQYLKVIDSATGQEVKT